MVIDSDILDVMISHARKEYPLEACGLLGGKGLHISSVFRCSNQRLSATEFSISPEELIQVFKGLREQGLKHLGIYHSHPRSDAYPSARDVQEMYYPGISYWIVSLQAASPVVRCFMWKEKTFWEDQFSVVAAQ